MTKVVTLTEETVIDGKLYLKGEVVPVDDGFNTNIKNVIADSVTQKTREATSKEAIKPPVKEGDGGSTK